MAIEIIPIAIEHAAGFHACLDAVAREKRYLARIGERLLRACLDKARAKGLTRIYLHVRADNQRAIRLYRHVGFAEEAVLKRGMRFDGVYYDAVQMSQLLD